jgi:hypothetical protein
MYWFQDSKGRIVVRGYSIFFDLSPGTGTLCIGAARMMGVGLSCHDIERLDLNFKGTPSYSKIETYDFVYPDPADSRKSLKWRITGPKIPTICPACSVPKWNRRK